jgi:hypothetical protein
MRNDISTRLDGVLVVDRRSGVLRLDCAARSPASTCSDVCLESTLCALDFLSFPQQAGRRSI